MGIKSTTRDKRVFRHFAKMADDGGVASVVAVAEGSEIAESIDKGEEIDPVHIYVEVTNLYPYDLREAKARPADVAAKRVAAIFADLKAQDRGPKDKGQRGGQ